MTDGFLLGSGSDGSTIRGFVIQGFNAGISASDSGSHTIAGNYIGTSSTGNAAATNTVGIGLNFWNSANNTIGGTTALDRNVISGTSNIGINLTGASTGNQIRGNYIGVGSDGSTDVGNRWYGIYSSASGNTIGGNVSGAGNVISGNGTTGGGAFGVYLTSTASGTTIQGNIIGLNASGTSAIANDGHGIEIASNNNTIGGTSALERNVISGNNRVGLWITGNNNTVRGNYFGVGSDGTTSLGNGWDAITISGSNNLIGGTGANDGNILANSGDDGIEVSGSGTGNAFLGNSIYSNASMAIDLGSNNSTPTLNDFNDADSGTNGLQNFPVLKTATTTNGNTTITGKLNSTANTTYRIEFFSNPYGTAESTGYGEARTYLGFTTVTTDGNGNATFSSVLNGVSLGAGSTVTAAATVDLGSSYGSTSEFGGNIVANEANLLISGSYVGNGIDDRTIAGLGFRAEVIIVMSSNGTIIRTSTMAGDVSKVGGSATAVISNAIQSLTSDGFTVGTNSGVNTNGVTYHWVAFGAGDNLDVGLYTGNGTSQTISNVGFQAESAFVFGESGSQTVFRTNQNANTFDLSNNGAYASSITSFGTDSFAVGNSVATNQNAINYHYFAFNDNANYFRTGTYTGNGLDDRNITGVGFESEFIIIKATSANNFAIGKTESTGYNVNANVAGSTNQTQALQSDGFQVGSDATVNQNGTSYMYLAWRQHDAAIIVDTTSDSTTGSTTSSINALRASQGADGQISLREAILAANATRNVNGVEDEIQFAISGSGTQVISVASTLSVTDGVSIDGTTQSGWVQDSFMPIVLDGNNGAYSGLTLSSTADGSLIRGLVIRDFGSDGIRIESGSSGSTIAGNWLGTFDSSGTNLGSAEGNAGNGIYILGDSNRVGGTTAADRNVISGNLSHGIRIGGATASDNIVEGNYIGAAIGGSTAMGNNLAGIQIDGGATNNTVGGSTTASRNIIVSNGLDGVLIAGSTSHDNIIQNNFIGLGADGTTVLGNTGDGININGGSDRTIIGGVGVGNVIVGNRGNAIEIDGTSSGTVIQGNYIGVNLAGTVVYGSGLSGILIENGASNTTVGGTTAGQGNVITNSGTLGTTNNAGVQVLGSTTGISIIGNSIYDNNGIGIDLGTSGITANDTGDGDTGANNLQNFPVITATTVNAAGTTVTVSGTINSTASVTGMLLHFYATPGTGNVNSRQGRRYLGSTTVNTDGSGNATFTNVNLTGFTGTVAAGELITATATTPGANGNTSEFSQGSVATSTAGNVAPTGSQLTATNGGGLLINGGAGNSTYLIADDGGTLLGGRTQMTAEFQFSLSTAGVQHTFMNYAVEGVDNEVYLRTGSDGSLSLSIKGSSVTSSAVNFNTLVGTGPQTLSVTWNNATGTWQFFLNGTSFASGSGLQTGATLTSSGVLVLGHDQDVIGGGFQSPQAFKGTFHDVRLFSDVRTATEIASSFRSDLPRNEGNLIANWRFNDLSTAGVTTDAVSGNNLTVRHATLPGFTVDTPVLTLATNENATTGTVIGNVDGTDIEREARITALLAADPSLRYNAETGSFYKYVNSSISWTAALSAANSSTLSGVAGDLVRIDSAAENSFVWSLAAAQGNDIWIGAADTSVEGAWRWYKNGNAEDSFWLGNSTGTGLNNLYVNWASGEPSVGAADEDFGRLRATDGQWLDTITSINNRYVIEWNADDVLDATNALTYSIVSQSVSGAFAVNSDTGVITVANGTLLNFEAQTSHTLTVRVTDGSGATFDKAYTIALNNLTEENNAPTDLSGGINLNTDGGNNAYLMTSSGGSVLGGRTSLTMEISVAITTSVNENMLVSYAVPGQDNEVLFRVGSSGAILLTLDQTGGDVNTAAIPQLLDGKQHAIAFSWDNTAGDVRIYVDGQLVHTATGIKVGTTLDAGGTLVFGQEQDSINGSFTTSQRLSGTLYDIRVWDRAISDEQISLNYHQVPGSTETGLIANWRMSGLSGGNTVVDSVGGVNLTVANVAVGGGFTSSTPTTGLSVTENASVGTRVGQLLVTDADLSRDIVADGLFREAANPGVFTNYTTGQSFGNWTVTSGNVDLVGTGNQASPLGGRSVDINGNVPGAIAQTLNTVAGRQYQVLFNTSGNWSGGEATKDLRVSAGGTSQDFSLTQPNGWSTSNMLFSGRSMTFTAVGSSSTLAFQSLDTGGGGAVIADVRVIEIPAAVSAILSNDATLSYDAGTGKFYRAVNSNVNWSSALTAATSASINGVTGELVTIGSSYENDLVWSLARSINNNVWLGATDSVTEGTWRWYNGTSPSTTFWVGAAAGTLQSGQYANWRASEPNDTGGAEDFGHMWVVDGTWNDWTSGVTMGYVVEWDASEVLSNYTYTITSNPSGAFAINSNTGEITVSNAAPLSEIATDPTITVQVTDASGNTYSEVMTIAVARVNDNTPVITSNGGGATASINVAENSTVVTTITATDADLPAPTLTYSIVGGADSALFSISSSTGALSFISGRNFENPTDVGANNVYDVTIRVDDGTFWDDQAIAVTVTNVNEAPTDLYSVPNVTNANVLGYYSFTSASNLGRDDAGDNQSMTLFGSPTQTTRTGGSGAIDLSGGQYGNIAPMTTGGAMTIASWVRFDTTGTWERVIDFGQTNAGGIGSIVVSRAAGTNNLSFTIEKAGFYTHRATAFNAITNGTWMHFAATVDSSGNMALYVNGTLAGTMAGTAPDIGVRTNHFVGRSNFAADSAFDGAIDDLIITNGAMSAADVSALYQQTTGFTVAENAANTTFIGTLLATDPDAGNTYTYTLTNNAGGRFAINSTTGQITVANSSLLDFEAASSHTVTARVTDQNGLTYDEVVTISLTNVNEAPVMTPSSPTLPLSENGSAFAASVSSLLGSSVTDPDAGAVEGIAVTNLSLGGGTLEYSTNGTTWTAVSGVSTTNALLLRATDQMRFTPSSTNGGTTLISFNAWDQTSGTAGGFANATITGGSTAFSVATDTVTVNVTSVNDAPVLDNSSAMTLTSITEDQTTNSGQTIASIIASAGGDRITDVDSGAVEGIAITTLSSGNGTWQYSLDGTNWTNVGTVSDSSSLLLRSTDFIRFVPNAQNATTASFDFRAWDQSSGSAGSKVATTTNGNATAFSTATESASITVTAVNDNIGSLSDSDAAANAVAENATIGATVGITALATDVDSADTVTYSLDFNANGRYAINSSTGVVTVASALNAESQFTETILVRATSSDGSVVTRGYTITVTSVNEAPNDIRIPVSVVSENFESGATGWSNNQTVAGGGTLTNYLGGWGNEIGTTQVFKDFTLSGDQSSVTITFDMYEMDSWDGEAFKVWVDNVEYSSHTLWMDWYSNFYLGREDEIAITQQITDGLSSLDGDLFDDEIHRYTFTINTTSTNIRLGFSSTLDSPASNESWGVDNLTIVENRPALTVAENSANTTVLGTVQGYDVDAATTLTYSLTDTAGGRFAINASTGAITVANSSLLNFEAAASHSVTVQISDGSLTYSEAVTINLTNVNEGPAAVLDTATAVEAGGTANGIAGTNPTGNVLTNDTDVDAGDSKTVAGVAAGVVGSASTNVGLAVNGSYGSITIAVNGAYTYTVNNSNATVQALAVGQSINDVFTYTMQDAGGLTSTTQITVTVQGANDAPVHASIEGSALNYNENAGAVAISSTIAITDVDNANIESAAVAITGNYVNGQDVLGFTNQNGITGSWNATTGELTLTGSATVAQYQAALRSISYTNSSETPSTLTRTVSFTVNDGTANSNTQTRDINVASINDAPVLDNTRTPVLLSVSEHAGAPVGSVGTLISSLVDFATPSGQVDNVTDVDASPTTGIAITATNAVNGTWWYSTNNGSTWQRIGNVSDASARLLAADSNTRIYFEPTQSTEFSGTISNAVTFRAWDGTSGSNGGAGDTTVNGGTTAFSANTDTAAITVNNVNDAPRILGNELITNGDFTTNLSGWTTSGSVAVAGGRANFGLSNAVGPHSISQTISTIAGQTYQLSFDYLDGSSTLNQSLVATVSGIGNLLTTNQLVTDVATTAPGARYTFTFVADSSSATITLTDTSDQSGLSSGTANVDGLVDNVSVSQLAGQMGTLNYTENAGPVAIHSTLNLSDFDSANLVGATVQFTAGFNVAEDVLTFANQLGITGSYNPTTGVLTLSGSATVANYQTALRSITYENTSEAPTGSRTISFIVDDGSATSAVGTRSVSISNVNDAPIAVADTATATEAGGVSNGTAGTNPTGNVLTNDTDVDGGDTKTVTGVAAGVQGSAAGSVASAVSGTYGSISIAADGTYTYSVDNNNATVQALRSTSNTLTDVFTYTMQDAGGLTSTTQITVTIQGANDAPVIATLEAAPLAYTENSGPVAVSATLSLVDVDDANISSAVVQITGNFINGQDALSFTNQNGITGTWNPTTGVLALSGSASKADYEAALRSITYTNSSENPNTATRTVSFTISDGDVGSTVVTRDIAIASVNDAPLLTIPGSQAIPVNGSLTLSGANAIQVADVDAASGTLQVTLTVAQGTVSLASTAGLTFNTGDGTSDASMIFTGTLAAVNAALDGLSYAPTGGYSGTASIGVVINDLGNTGTGGNLTDSETVFIQVGGARFQEGVGGYIGTQDTFITSGSANTSYGNLSYVISNNPNNDAIIRFDNLFGSGAGQIALGSTIQTASLSIYVTDPDSNDTINVHRMLTNWSEASTWNTLTNGISNDNVEASSASLFAIDAGRSGWVTITGITSVVQDWANGASNFGFTLRSDNADNWEFYSSEFSNAALRPYLTIGYATPQLAAIDLDANNSSGASGSGFATTWTENGGPVSIADLDATLTDADSTHLQSMTVTITNRLNGTLESLAANTSGTAITASYNSTTGELTLTGADTVGNYQQVLRSITYNNSSESPNTTARQITIQAADAFVQGNIATATINITAVNDAPVLDNSGNLTLATITEDSVNNTGHTVASILASDGGTPISDVDSGSQQGIAITSLNTGFGKWQYSLDGGSSWLDVGSVSNASALLLRSTDSIRFLPQFENGSNPDFTFRAWDQTSGSAGTKVSTASNGGITAFSTATETASIVVTAVNDAPVLDAARTPVLNPMNEDAGLPVGAVGTLVSSLVDFQLPGGQVDNVADDDIGSQLGIAITGVNAANGTWYYSTNNGTDWQTLGSVSDSNARLLAADSSTRIYFAPTLDYNGTINNAITFRAWDQSNGSNGSLADTTTNGGTTAFSTVTDTAALTINAVNDNPIAVADNATATEAGGVANGSAGANPSGNVLTNDTDVDAGDTKSVIGVSAGVVGSAAMNVGSAVTGSFGSITIAANGSYTYTVNNSNATVQALANSAESIQDVFTYTITDAAGTSSTTQITVTIQGANDAPTIASNGGGGTASITMAENITAVTTVVGSDVDAGTTFTYSILGGADAVRFSITAGGSLAFVAAPDFEAPSDVGGNNVYDVIVEVSDGVLSTTQALAVTITDVSNFLVVTTATDNNDSGIANGASYDIEWLNANRGADGSVSLREAIIASNNTVGTDTVNFSITGTGVKTMNVASALPAITDTIVINGYSQTGSSANTLAVGNNAVLNVVLDGTGAGAGASGLTLSAGSAGSSIRGLVIDNFSQYGISVNSANNTLAGNFIGLNQAGNAAAGNNVGIYINNVGGNTIGGLTAADRNIISGNISDGVYITGASATGNLIQGNYIGTNAAGTASVANGSMGVRITGNAAGNTVGGAAAGAGNLISGNASSGVYIDASNTTVTGNLIGTNAAGTGAVRNGSIGSTTGGVFIASGTGSVIGGTTAAERNVLSGNGGAGIWIEGTTGSHTIQGNYIGVDINGDTALGNGRWGISLNSGAITNIQIGGTAAGAGNVISGSAAGTGGIFVGSASGTVIEGNRIGIGATTTTALAAIQDVGIRVNAGATNTRIGGSSSAAGNIIARNHNGIVIVGNTSGTNIQRNAIYGNSAMAIDLGNDGATANDGALTTGQPNQGMDRPVLSNANLVGNNLSLAGYVGSAANQATFANSRVEFYKTTASSSVFLGQLTTDANGNFSGTLDVTGLGLTQSDPIIATATDPNGNTSEYSISFEANAAPTANADTNTAVEAGGGLNASAGTNPTGNVLTNDTDPNAVDTQTVSGVAAGTVGTAVGSVGSAVTGAYGSIQIAANGSYTYTVDNNNAAVQSLRTAGNTLTDVFTYTMRDTGGLTSTTQVTITIQGANDAPVGVVDNGAAVEAGGVANGTAGSNATGNVLANDADVDSGDAKTVSGVAAGVQASTSGSVNTSVAGSYGAISIAADGSYTYSVDNSNAAVQALRTNGQSLADVFSYTFVDTAGLASTTQVTITVTGANDAPTAVADTTIAIEAGGTSNGAAGTNPIGNVLSNDTDPDTALNGETKTVSGVATGVQASASGSVAVPVNGTYGSITISAGGAYSYAVDNSNSAVQALRTSSDTLTDVFTYTMVDAGGLASTAQITVTIQGANDAPVAFNDAGTANEAGGVANGTAGSTATGNVLSNDTDVDSGDTRAVHGVVAGVQASATGSVAASVTGAYGSVTIAADGSYTYVVDEANATVQALRTSGQSITDVFT
ncbi:MAG: VCBS domain-containing protein [Pirellulaceae bacterium]|nr:VCBS domain-containing protein [Pirellulaceae bacterium]